MDIDFHRFVAVHLRSEPRYALASTALAAPCGVAPPCGQEPAASSRLAWHADLGTGKRVQLPFLG
jgi:hypothetical protein